MISHWKSVSLLLVAGLFLVSCSTVHMVTSSGGTYEEDYEGSWSESFDISYEPNMEIVFPGSEPEMVTLTITSTLTLQGDRFKLEVFGPQRFDIIAGGGRDIARVYNGDFIITDDSLILEYDEPNQGRESFGYSLNDDQLSLTFQGVVGHSGPNIAIVSLGSRVWSYYSYYSLFKNSGTFDRAQ